MYNGKEVCQGCGKPGSENRREDKNSLCYSCNKDLKLGRAKEVEVRENYTYVKQFYHALSQIDFNDKLLNHGLHKVLTGLDNKFAQATDTRIGYIKQYYDNSYCVTVPTDIVEPIKTLFLALDNEVIKLKKEKEALSSKAKLEAYAMKDELFQLGVKAGKNLLLGLNTGEINMNDFDKHIGYKE